MIQWIYKHTKTRKLLYWCLDAIILLTASLSTSISPLILILAYYLGAGVYLGGAFLTYSLHKIG